MKSAFESGPVELLIDVPGDSSKFFEDLQSKYREKQTRCSSHQSTVSYYVAAASAVEKLLPYVTIEFVLGAAEA